MKKSICISKYRCFFLRRILRKALISGPFSVVYYTIPRTTRELQRIRGNGFFRGNYTISRTTREQQPAGEFMQYQNYYTIPRTTRELQQLRRTRFLAFNYTIPRTTREHYMCFNYTIPLFQRTAKNLDISGLAVIF